MRLESGIGLRIRDPRLWRTAPEIWMLAASNSPSPVQGESSKEISEAVNHAVAIGFRALPFHIMDPESGPGKKIRRV